ncbi:MAG: DUF2461 domain-containing protein [Muribaculaceae bacterium]
MKEILQFVRDLAQNNNREWFNANKPRYQAVLKQWQEFCLELINEIGSFDDDIANLTIKDCTYRIYRDTRFSPDKTPYKTHFGVFLCPGGKKSMHAGYYFHLGTGESDSYPHAHMLASGNYCYDPAVVPLLREDISDGWDDFSSNVLGVADKRFSIDMDDALKKVPKGYPTDAPYADFMRLKNYCLVATVDDDFITSPNLARRLAEIFHTTKPFNDFVNRAVDYTLTESR